MSFLGHLEEFRWTIGRSLIAFVVGLVLATVLFRHRGFPKDADHYCLWLGRLVDQI